MHPPSGARSDSPTGKGSGGYPDDQLRQADPTGGGSIPASHPGRQPQPHQHHRNRRGQRETGDLRLPDHSVGGLPPDMGSVP